MRVQAATLGVCMRAGSRAASTSARASNAGPVLPESSTIRSRLLSGFHGCERPRRAAGADGSRRVSSLSGVDARATDVVHAVVGHAVPADVSTRRVRLDGGGSSAEQHAALVAVVQAFRASAASGPAECAVASMDSGACPPPSGVLRSLLTRSRILGAWSLGSTLHERVHLETAGQWMMAGPARVIHPARGVEGSARR
jgi:hypothetical protein